MWRNVTARRLVGAVAAALLALAVPLAAAPASAAGPPFCGDDLPADLGTGILHGADSVTLLYEKTVTFRMINLGPGCTGPATLTITGLPSKPTISSETPCRWSSGKVVCTVDNLTKYIDFSVVLTLETWTPRWVTTMVSAEKPDPHTGNNTSRQYICMPGTKMTNRGPDHCATPPAKTVHKASSSRSPSPAASASPTASASPSPLETPSVSATATLAAVAGSPDATLSITPVIVISVVCGVAAVLVVAALTAVALILRRRRPTGMEIPQEPLP